MTAIGIWQMGQGAFEIVTGLGSMGASGGAAFLSGGLALPLTAASATVSAGLIASGVVRVGIGVALFRNNFSKNNLVENNINSKIYKQLEIQYERDGKKSILKSLKSAEKTLIQHKEKLPYLKHKSQVEGTIQNVEKQIQTIKKFIKDKQIQ